MNISITPILGEITKGPYAGVQFSWMGYNDIVPFINPFKIYGILKGTHPVIPNLLLKHITVEEALPLRYTLTAEMASSLSVV